ncbi:MAG: DNA gyrase subunit A [Promethearchaeota archaeon]
MSDNSNNGKIGDEMLSSPKIMPGDLNDHMSVSYLDYAFSVIVGRAIPDVRDGLKPVHRRIAFSMYQNKFTYNSPHKKCARIVGDVLGKYHPHGDTSVYEALVRMGQEFSMRYPLIDKQGNFGSIDGDPPAAMRYTEARLARISNELLADIEKDTVDYMPNFDESLQEPIFLPSKLPTLLMNGSSGIAVGMSTNMPPYNLREIISAIKAVIDTPDMYPEEINNYITGPDFPTKGIIVGRSGIHHIINTGRGKIRIRGRVEIVEKERHKLIIITEIPYQINKSILVTSIAKQINDRKLIGVSDLTDESARGDVRIVLKLTHDADPNAIIHRLYKRTRLETSYSVVNLVLVNKGKRPYVLNMMGLIKSYIICRDDVITKRTVFDLKKDKKRRHIIEGLLIAISNIDDFVTIIKSSKDVSDAKFSLIKKYNLSDEQVAEILNMPLRRLTGLQLQKLNDEKVELEKNIGEYKKILADRNLRMEIIKQELKELDVKYGDDRRTEIISAEEDDGSDDFIHTVPEETCVIMLTENQYIKRMTQKMYQSQHRGGKGKKGISKREEDIIKDVFVLSSHDSILLFTRKGRVYSKYAYEIPLMKRTSRGKAIVNFISLRPGEKIVHMVPISEFSMGTTLIFVTRRGMVKKTNLKRFKKIRKTGVKAIRLRKDDELVNVKPNIEGENMVAIFTQFGYAIKFPETELRPLGRTAMGVRGIRFREGDEVVDMVVGNDDIEIITITKKGYGKRSKLELYRKTRRGGKGVINIKFKYKDDIVNAVCSASDEDILIATISGMLIRVPSVSLRSLSRSAQGVRVISLNDDDFVTSIALCGAVIDSCDELEDEHEDEQEDEIEDKLEEN